MAGGSDDSHSKQQSQYLHQRLFCHLHFGYSFSTGEVPFWKNWSLSDYQLIPKSEPHSCRTQTRFSTVILPWNMGHAITAVRNAYSIGIQCLPKWRSEGNTVVKKLTQPIKWHGGKNAFNGKLAKWIVSLMPPHLHYVEPYFGGGAVLLNKDPTNVSEVVNDLNSELTTFWQVLQCPINFETFTRLINAVPFSEVEFESAMQNMKTMTAKFAPDKIPDGFNAVNRAAWFFIRARQSRQGLMKDFATLSRNRTRSGMNEQVSAWLKAIHGLSDVHERLKRVVILNRPAIEVIKQQDGAQTVFYLDPPYLHETRTAKAAYDFEMDIQAHQQLLATLQQIESKWLLSGYHSELYDDWAASCGFDCQEFDIVNNASSKATKDTKTECVWTNF